MMTILAVLEVVEKYSDLTVFKHTFTKNYDHKNCQASLLTSLKKFIYLDDS